MIPYFFRLLSIILLFAVLLFVPPRAARAEAQDLDSVKKPSGPGFFEQIDLFTSGENGYKVYRIPALLATQKGALLAFAEARRNGPADHGDIDLVVKRSSDNGRTWSKSIIVYSKGERTVGNPAPVQDRDTGVILLPFTIDNETVHVTKSEDDGETWAPPADITKQVKPGEWRWYATGPGHGIQLKSGRLLVPCDHNEKNAMYSHTIYSDDHGETWKTGGSLPKLTDEAMAVELADGSVLINMRSNHMRGLRAIARSTDGGDTWSDIKFDPDLVEPVCQASIIRYSLQAGEKQGRNRLLFANPASRVREKMTVKMSYDEGKSWPVFRLVNEGFSGYSDLAVLPDNTVGLIYENGKRQYWEKISFARFDLTWISGGKDRF